MQNSALTTGPLTAGPLGRFSDLGAARLRGLLIAAALLGLMGALSPEGLVQLAMVAAAMTVLALSVLMFAISRRQKARRALAFSTLSDFIENDASPSLVTDGIGQITSMNAAARARFDMAKGQTLAGVVRDTFANPGGIIHRLKLSADAEGSAREDIVTRKDHIRLAVHLMGSDAYLWRMETIPDRMSITGHEEPGLPMIMVGRTGAILFMNDGARTLIGHRPKTLDRVFPNGVPVAGDVAELSTRNGTLYCLVSEIDSGAGRRAIYLLPTAQAETQKAPADTWATFERLPVPLVLVTPDGHVEAHNRSAAALVGDSMFKGVHLSSFMEGLGRPIADWLAETVAGRAVQHSEFLRLKRADKEVFVQVTLNRVTENGVASVIAVLTDATELKTLEAQFVQSQKMQAIGQLAGGVAHDFNNLLTAISGHCDLLLLRHDHGDADYGDLVQINQNANRAAALVGQLLAFSRKQTLRPEKLDMRDTLSDLTHLLNRLVGEKVTLTLSHDPMLQAIRADKRQLEQVLMNLVVNARDAMPDGGEIRIETECITLSAPMKRDRVTVPEGKYVTVRVVDRGIGIAPDKLQKVFEPFFTTKRTGEGTGLGLSTAYGIVKQTGGFIFVDSTEGEGTCFSLLFPVVEGASLPAHRSLAIAEVASYSHGDGVILLVEDEAPVRAFASRALRLRGYTVLEADCAEAALKTLEDADLNVDLFVTDVVMPGKDGPSWVREALKSRPEVRVVFVSGYAEDKLNNDQASIPNSVFLPKPFSLNELTETVHKQLH